MGTAESSGFSGDMGWSARGSGVGRRCRGSSWNCRNFFLYRCVFYARHHISQIRLQPLDLGVLSLLLSRLQKVCLVLNLCLMPLLLSYVLCSAGGSGRHFRCSRSSGRWYMISQRPPEPRRHCWLPERPGLCHCSLVTKQEVDLQPFALGCTCASHSAYACVGHRCCGRRLHRNCRCKDEFERCRRGQWSPSL